MSITIDRTELCWTKQSVDAAIPNSHNLHCTVTEKLQKHAGLKEELIIMWQLQTVHAIPPQLLSQTVHAIPPQLCYPKRITGKFKTA
jgi:hypothetical protein